MPHERISPQVQVDEGHTLDVLVDGPPSGRPLVFNTGTAAAPYFFRPARRLTAGQRSQRERWRYQTSESPGGSAN